MSAASRPMYRAIFTLWRKLGKQDRYGNVEYSAPIYIACQSKQGSSSSYSDSKGREFMPKTTFWTELRDEGGDLVDQPVFGDLIAVGRIDSAKPSDSFPVRVIEQFDVSLFDTVPDYKSMTG